MSNISLPRFARNLLARRFAPPPARSPPPLASRPAGTTDDSNCSSYMDLRDCDASTSTESTIDEYLNLIYSDLSNNVKPVVVKFGAVGANEIRTKNLYLTNYNPVPVNVTISAGEVSGMSVNLGRIESPIDTIVDLDDKGKYLLLSDDNSDYASKIYTYDVRFSSRVPQELMEQYEKFPDSSVFGSEAGRKVDEGDLQDLKGYKVDPGAGVAGSQHVKAPKWKNTGGNGVLVSLDGMFEHKLKGEKKKGGEEVVTLPPGGIARLGEANRGVKVASCLVLSNGRSESQKLWGQDEVHYPRQLASLAT